MFRVFVCVSAVMLALSSALAQDDIDPPETIEFDGGAFTITQNENYERVLTYDGQEIARNFVVSHDKTVEIADVKVALFSVANGGNQCGAATLIAWKKDDALRSQMVGEECGSPPAGITESRIYFVPYLLPGETSIVQYWSPDDGLRTAGDLTFTPQPNTDWQNFDVDKLQYMVEAFDNAAVYEAGKALLGSSMTDVVTGLLTGGGAEKQTDGMVTGYGCVPHACGASDTFMAIDPRARKLYLAQQTDGPEPKAWPALGEWPDDLRAAMDAAIGQERQ
ncbi:hypothetical protein [Arvimicrobium flavum]|uniref:hypothetical protein n=1 Tax=Arvimicrobium flavum TaxID=3393320 RepID=UPI00237A6390|nr:hypothetical protein [Mesorhizobium shangrilense]